MNGNDLFPYYLIVRYLPLCDGSRRVRREGVRLPCDGCWSSSEAVVQGWRPASQTGPDGSVYMGCPVRVEPCGTSAWFIFPGHRYVPMNSFGSLFLTGGRGVRRFAVPFWWTSRHLRGVIGESSLVVDRALCGPRSRHFLAWVRVFRILREFRTTYYHTLVILIYR